MGDNDDTGGRSEPDSSIITCGKGSKNKRKYLSEFPPDAIDTSAQSLTEFPRYELLEEKNLDNLNEPGLQGESSDDPLEKQEVDEHRQDDWDDPVACELLELLKNNLKGTFQSAIKKIVESGYSEEIVEKSLLKHGLHHGTDDVVSNATEGALAWLREKGLETSTDYAFENLDELVDFTILEMIISIREIKPWSTVVEVMWSLLITDLSLVHASAENKDHLVSAVQESPGESSSLTPSQSKPEDAERSLPNLNISKHLALGRQIFHSENHSCGVDTQLPDSNNPQVHEVAITKKESLVPHSEPQGKSLGNSQENAQTVSLVAVVEEKSRVPRKGLAGNLRRETLRLKALQLEKSYKARISKGALKAKLGTWGGMAFDKTLKSSSSSFGLAKRSTYSKLTTSIGGDPLPEENYNVSNNSASVPQDIDTPGMLAASGTVYALPAVSNKVPASSAFDSWPASRCKAINTVSSEVPDYYAGIPYDESLGKYVPQDEKEETVLTLGTHMKDLQKEIQAWKDWATEKVKQAAQRLSKEQGELKMLRQEKEEAERFRKEKPLMEESTMKRLSEMEYALSNAKSQIEMAQRTLRKLEDENAVLKVELEAARFKAVEASKSLQEVLQKEQEAWKKSQERDVMKASLQEELTALKHHTIDLQRQHKQAKDRMSQLEALWKPEQMEKQKYLEEAEKMRRLTEQRKAQTKKEEDCMREAAETENDKCNEEIKVLENEISQLRLVSESSRIAALLGSLHIGCTGSLKGSKTAFDSREFQMTNANNNLAVSQDNFRAGGVKPERECVMCLTEEMSVVFFPCAHQVLCTECNVRHEKQGMNECPSCRTPIQERISARFVDTQEP